MRPIRVGDRGPAVEDVQRRLLVLGYDLGSTGVDGVFLGRTADAVNAFQRGLGLEEDGVVGPQTWAALVDETFTLGDRMLYMRSPHLHGRDIRLLQGALNVLGFSSGTPDGIFGAFAERAVREFQANSGLVPDGIAGPETVRALVGLRHVWEGKDPTAPVRLAVAPARRAGVLAGAAVLVTTCGDACLEVASRLVNLATAAEADSAFRLGSESDAGPDTLFVLHLTDEAETSRPTGVPEVRFADAAEGLVLRFVTAAAVTKAPPVEVRVVLDAVSACDERSAQRTAVALLDAVCAALT